MQLNPCIARKNRFLPNRSPEFQFFLNPEVQLFETMIHGIIAALNSLSYLLILPSQNPAERKDANVFIM